jgi:anti-sigma regulatory factor (Ser/Thr protein kinase)
VTAAGCLPVTEDVAWLLVEDPSAPGRARRVVANLAERLGFSATRVAEIGIAVTEIGTNLHNHAHAGVLAVRAVRAIEQAAVEVVAIDSGPGIADVTEALRDGRSTAGTLGVGLGAVTRLADSHQLFSEVGRGTVLVTRFHPRQGGSVGFGADHVGGLTRPIDGEDVCGDAYAVWRGPGWTRLMMCDGSGHGPLAASASRAAVRVFCDDEAGAAGAPEDVLRRIHTALRGTRGGAVAVVHVDATAGTVRFAGLGNIAGSVVSGGRKQGMVSVPGVAGYQARTIRAFDYALPSGAAVVLHSDGLTEKWGAEGRERVFTSSPLVIASTLLRDAGVRKDDAGVLVCVPPAP